MSHLELNSSFEIRPPAAPDITDEMDEHKKNIVTIHLL